MSYSSGFGNEVISDNGLRKWISIIEDSIGITVPWERRGFLSTNLFLRIKKTGVKDIKEYEDLIFKSNSSQGKKEWLYLIDSLTVHETRFFRHPEGLEFFEKVILEKTSDDPSKTIKILSVGCSTGEEPYGLAMLANEITSNNGGKFFITGVDVSAQTINKAIAAEYHIRNLSNVSDVILKKYFKNVDECNFRVEEHIRNRVLFKTVSALSLDGIPVAKSDIAYCQNMLIYFSEENRKKILDNIVDCLAPNSYLILGNGEDRGWFNEDAIRLKTGSVLAYKVKS